MSGFDLIESVLSGTDFTATHITTIHKELGKLLNGENPDLERMHKYEIKTYEKFNLNCNHNFCFIKINCAKHELDPGKYRHQ